MTCHLCIYDFADIGHLDGRLFCTSVLFGTKVQAMEHAQFC